MRINPVVHGRAGHIRDEGFEITGVRVAVVFAGVRVDPDVLTGSESEGGLTQAEEVVVDGAVSVLVVGRGIAGNHFRIAVIEKVRQRGRLVDDVLEHGLNGIGDGLDVAGQFRSEVFPGLIQIGGAAVGVVQPHFVMEHVPAGIEGHEVGPFRCPQCAKGTGFLFHQDGVLEHRAGAVEVDDADVDLVVTRPAKRQTVGLELGGIQYVVQFKGHFLLEGELRLCFVEVRDA